MKHYQKPAKMLIWLMLIFVLSSCGSGESQPTACTDAAKAVDAATISITSFDSAPTTISATSFDNAVYVIQGNNMDGVAGIQLDVAYDAALLSSPIVTQGSLVSGGLLAANSTIPGFVRVVIISSQPFSGSGPIVKIKFAAKNPTAPPPTVKSIMTDSNGSQIASQSINPSSGTPASGVTTSQLTPCP